MPSRKGNRKLNNKEIVCLVLRKLRLAESFAIIALELGISESQASRLFASYLPVLAQFLRKLVFWPPKQSIKNLCPLQFRLSFSDIQSVVECFEIEIEKPSNPVYQSLTWSEYKSCNTIKYFVSITPDGLVNFISTGFGGRASDLLITEVCGFLDRLPPDECRVMADRGFKNVESLLIQRGSTLVRPHSVSAGSKRTPQQIKESKIITGFIDCVVPLIRLYYSLICTTDTCGFWLWLAYMT